MTVEHDRAEQDGRRARELVADGTLDVSPPGRGATRDRHRTLADLGRQDLAVGRLAEAHVDALAILADADLEPAAGALYGVWAADRPPGGLRLDGDRSIAGRRGFCSGADLCDRALVTVGSGAEAGRLVEVDLATSRAQGTATVDLAAFAHHPFLRTTRTGAVRFDRTSVVRVVGAPGWYTARPGFWHGAVGPAAVWAGGAAGLVDHALVHATRGAHVDAHLGALRAVVWGLDAVLDAAAAEIDADPSDAAGGARARALSVRHLVERSASEVLDRYGRAMGPAPVAADPSVAERCAGLAISIRQSHAESDLEDLEHHSPVGRR